MPKSFPNGEDVDGDLGELEPLLESEAKLLRTWSGEDMKDALLGVETFFFEADGGLFSSLKFLFDICPLLSVS